MDDQSLNNPAGDVVSLDLLTNDSDIDGTIDPNGVNLTAPGGATSVQNDIDGDVIGFTVPGEGSWDYDPITGLLSFTPEPGFTGNPTDITYTVDDNDGNTSNIANINVEYLFAPPIANDDTNVTPTAIGDDTTLDLLANDILSDGSTPLPADVAVDLDLLTAGVQTTLNVAGEGDWSYNPLTGIATFSPEAGFTTNPTGIDYELTDLDNGLTDSATITVIYQQPPVAVDDQSLNNPAGDVVSLDLLTNDSDIDGTIDPNGVNLTAPGGATSVQNDINGDVIGFTVPGEGDWDYDPITGLLSFTPEAGFTGNPTDITYTVDDNDGNTSNLANINVEYLFAPPIANDDASSGNSTNNPVILNALVNDELADGSTPSPDDVFFDFIVPAGATSPITGANGTIIGFTVPGEGGWLYDELTGEITFTPEPGFTNNPTAVDYNIIDADTGQTSIAPATVTIDFVIQAPLAADDEDLNNTPATNVSLAILTNDSDPDGNLDPNGVDLNTPAGATSILTDLDGDVIGFTVPGEGSWDYDPITGLLTFSPESGFIEDPTPITYTVDDNDGNPSNSATVVVDYLEVADLSLIKTVVDNDITPFIGTEITFEIRVTNDGPANATGVIVEDLLPSGYDFILYSSTTGVYDEITGVWTVGNLINGATETLLIDVLVNETGTYLNGAEVTASDILDLDSPRNNNILAEDDQDEVDVVPQLTPRIDLSVTKTADTMTPNVGGPIEFTITVQNDGPSDATMVVVTDMLAAGYEYQSSTVSIGIYEPLNGSWTVGDLPAGMSETMTITATVLSAGKLH